MKLSVIIPYYNCNAWIGKLLDSLLDQDLSSEEYEIIVVDDESPEDPVVLRDYAARFPQIHSYRNAHAGVSAARNFGMGVAKGEWFYFCDSDDFLPTRVLGGIIAAAEERQLEMVYGRYHFIFPKDPIPSPTRRNFANFTEVCTGMAYLGTMQNRLSFGMGRNLEASGILFHDIFYVEDRLFLLDLMPHVQRVARIDVDLYYYIQHEVSITHSRKKHDSTGYADAMILYMQRLLAMAKDSSTPAATADLCRKTLVDDAINTLGCVFRYGRVKETEDALTRLSAIGAYPLQGDAGSHRQLLQKLINRRGLWLFLCRLFHVLPFSLRLYT